MDAKASTAISQARAIAERENRSAFEAAAVLLAAAVGTLYRVADENGRVGSGPRAAHYAIRAIRALQHDIRNRI